MSLSNPFGHFGIHSACFYNNTSGAPISYMRVLKESGLGLNPDFEKLEGGSLQYAWAAAVKSMNAEFKLTGQEYPGEAMELLLGGSLTTNSAESTGAVDGVANFYGSTIINGSNGIDTVELTSSDDADLKEGKYLLVATAPAVVSLYGYSDTDFKRGTDLTFSDDTLLIESGIDVSAGDVEIEELGITLSKVGIPAFTTGHSAVFWIRKPNTSSIELVLGESGAIFSEFGLLLASPVQPDGSVITLDIVKCVGGGMPLNFNEKAWSQWEANIQPLYDATLDRVAVLRRTKAA